MKRFLTLMNDKKRRILRFNSKATEIRYYTHKIKLCMRKKGKGSESLVIDETILI